jgi:hypothetical protein
VIDAGGLEENHERGLNVVEVLLSSQFSISCLPLSKNARYRDRQTDSSFLRPRLVVKKWRCMSSKRFCSGKTSEKFNETDKKEHCGFDRTVLVTKGSKRKGKEANPRSE